ncbi:hypothetical protein HY045_01060 [Candidatus Woesebacteria bacterium]|nr:hypothetical protein [Candidatus Woesebacteria bacterium]
MGTEIEIIKSREYERSLAPLVCYSVKTLHSIIEECKTHPHLETGGFIFGQSLQIFDNKKAFVVYGTFTPPNEITRTGGHLSLGGETCGDFYDWQKAHWKYSYPDYLKRFGRENTGNGKVGLLGVWHKHPGKYIDFSGEDNHQVNSHLTQGLENYIFPIVIRYNSRESDSKSKLPHLIRIVDDNCVYDIATYYRSRGSSNTFLAMPLKLDSGLFPNLADTPWHIQNPIAFEEEYNAFSNLGFSIEIVPKIPKGKREGEIWLILKHQFLREPIYITTPGNYYLTRTFNLFSGNPNNRGTKIGSINSMPEGLLIADTIGPIINYLLSNKKQ